MSQQVLAHVKQVAAGRAICSAKETFFIGINAVDLSAFLHVIICV